MKPQPKFPKKIKKVTHAKAKQRAWVAFSKYIRQRDCYKTTRTYTKGKCYTCDITKPIELLDAGHYRPGRHYKFLFDEIQVHAQCKTCNLDLQGNGAMYYKRMVKEYGEETADAIIQENKELLKYTTNDLLELERYYKGMQIVI